MEFQKTNRILIDDKTRCSWAVPSSARIEIATYKLVGSDLIVCSYPDYADTAYYKGYLDDIVMMLPTILHCPYSVHFTTAKKNIFQGKGELHSDEAS